ncbi:hypothetical protein TW81_01615 [Vibrio galatheae]|uniref:Uncharacterized protein n=1 Tax=Vibrio galatheae TaxID=579748 RepID=A0A0F4NSJ9_9VIBR|nr:hypothetical protein [Vibrio galatheae]KJY85046.1 hypothetical protein TW81_01615 [Vibrio galatheae]
MRCLTLFTLLFSATLWANTLVLSGISDDELKLSIQSSWLHCEPQVWCSDELFYYRESFIAEARISPQKFSIQLFAEYSAHLLSQLQLHLRQDGFSLTSVNIEEMEFDVASALKEVSAPEADRDLVLFLNRYPPEAMRTIYWQNPNWEARLFSDGELVSLTVTPR